MAACVDVPRWANFRQDTCAKYASTGLCAGGRVVDANASGSVFGYPERACCACGRSETMQRAEANDRVSSVDQIALLGTRPAQTGQGAGNGVMNPGADPPHSRARPG